MADTRLKAVATAENSLRTLSAGVLGSEPAIAVSGTPAAPGDGMTAAAETPWPGMLNPVHPASGRIVFAHTFLPLRPISVRAGTSVRPGLPHLRDPRLSGLCFRSHAHDPNRSWCDVRLEHGSHTQRKVPMGADCGHPIFGMH